MAVTAFETYIEDFLQEKFLPLLKAEHDPEKFKFLFELVAKKWLREHASEPSRIREWTGDGWKKLLETYLKEQVDALNTPKSEIVIKIFRQFLDADLSKYWALQGYGFEQACARLDEIVTLRGRIAHVARKAGVLPSKHEVSRPDLKKYLNFLDQLVVATDKVLEPKKSTTQKSPAG